MKDFKLIGDFIPLCDLLKASDLCDSGGEAKNFIGDGKVLVDGVVELRKRCKIRVNQVVGFAGQQLKIV